MNILVLDTLPLRRFIPFLPISLLDSPLVLKCVRKGLFESLLGSASSCQSKLIMLLLPEDDCTSLPALFPKLHSFCEGCRQFRSGEEEREEFGFREGAAGQLCIAQVGRNWSCSPISPVRDRASPSNSARSGGGGYLSPFPGGWAWGASASPVQCRGRRQRGSR